MRLFNINTSYDGDASRLFDAMTVKPPAQDRYRYDQAVQQLKQNGDWWRLDFLHLPAAHHQQAARLNIVNPTGAALTDVGSPTFTAYRGFAGNDADSGLSIGIAHNALTKASQDSIAGGVWLNAGTDAASNTEAALGIVSGTLRLSLLPRDTGDVIGGRFNSSSGMSLGASTTILGHTGFSRTASNLTTGYKNGIAASTSTTASAAPSAAVLSYLFLTTFFSTFRIAAGWIGSGAIDQVRMHFVLREFLTPIGAP